MEIAEGDGYAILKWVNPTGPNYKLTKVIQKTDSAPTSLTDGKEIYSGKGTTVQANGLEVGSKYFWSVFTTNNLGKVSDPVSISYTPRTDPNSRFDRFNTYTFNSTHDVDVFCNKFNHGNLYANENEELSLGNKIIINDGTFNKTWIIAGFDCEHNKQASDGTTYDNGYGIFLIPEDSLILKSWNSNKNSYGAYINSEIHEYINQLSGIDNILKNHLILRNVLLSNTINYNDGTSQTYSWTKAYATLMSIGQITGTFGSNQNKYDDGEANYKLPLFNFINTWTATSYYTRNICGREHAWAITGENDLNKPGTIGAMRLDIRGGTRPLIMIR